MPRWPCPCCGHRVHDGGPGSHAVCPVCFWEDDPVQLRWPWCAAGANAVPLLECQRAFAETGVSEERFRPWVRPARAEEAVEPGFRPLDPDRDDVEDVGEVAVPWPEDLCRLYWWRPTFWRPAPECASPEREPSEYETPGRESPEFGHPEFESAVD